jgi:hypothetical protein
MRIASLRWSRGQRFDHEHAVEVVDPCWITRASGPDSLDHDVSPLLVDARART